MVRLSKLVENILKDVVCSKINYYSFWKYLDNDLTALWMSVAERRTTKEAIYNEISKRNNIKVALIV